MPLPENTADRPSAAAVPEASENGAEALPVDTPPAPCADSPPVDATQATTETALPVPAMLPVVEVRALDWDAIGHAVDAPAIRARMHGVIERMETLLDSAQGPGMLFDSDRSFAADRAIQVSAQDAGQPLWIIGDLHGDLLALEASLAQIQVHAQSEGGAVPRIIFLGDFFDDEGFGLELLLRVFELIVLAPDRVCVVAGNHDEALSYDGARFASTVSPSDFADFLNDSLAHEWIVRAGKLAVRLIAQAPRALFFHDGLLVAHGGFPLSDLHTALAETGDWNDPACLSDFVWGRAHPKARKKMPNRFSRGSQFGFEDFSDFCALSTRLGRPVTHMVRGHDHVENRYAIYPAYQAHPILTTVALSRRLNREQFGPHARTPTLARVVHACLPQVYQLHIPADLVNSIFAPLDREAAPAVQASEAGQP